ncbi:MAG: hypothetical protein CL946_02525 [Ectothiorhodospiraceae bacterium]|nr:hypothetical protein [Ectothiorhodospiraceae bacterium]
MNESEVYTQGHHTSFSELSGVDSLILTLHTQKRIESLLSVVYVYLQTTFSADVKVTYWVYQPSEDEFVLSQSESQDTPEPGRCVLPREELFDIGMAGATEVHDGVFIFSEQQPSEELDAFWCGMPPGNRIMLAVTSERRLEGFYLIDDEEGGFSEETLRDLFRIRAHLHHHISHLRAIDTEQRSRQKAEQANLVKTELLSIASHDLKNPISMILGFAELIKARENLDDDVKELVAIIAREGKRMFELVTELLDSTAIEMGKLELDIGEYDAVELVKQIVDIYSTSAARKRQQIHLQADGAAGYHVQVDESRILQVFDNLISNAVKYSPFDRSIYISFERVDGHVRINFTDEGPGLTEKDKQRVFDRFHKLSAKTTGGETSTGIGLSIVKQIVELHNGKVWVESQYGEGCTFTVELPTNQPRLES